MSKPTVSPFIAFCKANRDEVKAANPTSEFGEMGRLLWSLWNQLSDSEKAVYSEPRGSRDTSGNQVHTPPIEAGIRRSSRLRNKRLGLDFWGLKKNEKK
jgi:HMG (high mobility group) box